MHLNIDALSLELYWRDETLFFRKIFSFLMMVVESAVYRWIYVSLLVSVQREFNTGVFRDAIMYCLPKTYDAVHRLNADWLKGLLALHIQQAYCHH